MLCSFKNVKLFEKMGIDYRQVKVPQSNVEEP